MDDQCLSLILRGEEISEIENRSVFTTGYWYFRLCQAYFRSTSTGALSRPFKELEEPERSAAERQLLELPENIGLLSLREPAPTMARLTDAHPTINLLAREALAASILLDAKVVLVTSFPTPEAALSAEGRQSVIVGVDTSA
jgi:hypothetical protein